MSMRTGQARTKAFFSMMLVMLLLGMHGLAAARVDLPNFTELVDQYGVAIVNISTTQKVRHPKIGNLNRPEIPEGPFGDLFRHFFDDEKKFREFEDFNTKSLGSGFVISRDGYVLTNHHVIKDAEEVIVRLSDRRELVAKVIGSDEKSDIALIKIEAKDLPVVRMERKGDVKVGEWVLAIGSPFGFEHTVTAGIVSATGRSLPRENYVPFIQTDVAINPGNSGGPLFDMDGNVVGINSQIYSRTGGFMGLSFAIPIDVAMTVVDQIKDKGYVSRGWLGVLIQDVTRELAESMSLKKPEGALVSRVLPGSPAEQAGIRVGDVILEFDGREVSTSSSLPPIVGMTKVGSKIKVKVIRDGKPVSLSVTLGELPADEDLASAESTGRVVAGDRLGLRVSELNPEQRKRLGIEDRQGVLVTDVDDGAGRKSGVRRGDVIMMVDSTRVEGVAQFAELVKALPAGKSVRLLIQRGSGPVFIALRVPE